MPKSKSKGGQHKENPAKLATTLKRRERIAKGIAARKVSKPQPIPQAGRATRRLKKFGPPREQVAA